MRFDRPVRVGVTAAATLLLVFGLSGGVAAADEQQVPRLEADRMIPTTMVAPPELQAQMTQTRGEPLRVHPRNLRVEDDAKTMSTTILSESFEGSWPSGSWVVGPGSGAPDVYWGKTSYRRANGSYSAWCAKSGSSAPGTGGNVPSGTKSWMIAGPFDLTSFTGGEWAFNLWMESGAFNGGDGDYLGVYASTGGDYYGYFIEGSTTGWQTASLDWAGWYTLGDLNQYNSVYFAIIYTANSSSYEGAYVDDFTLTGEGGGAGGLNLTINQIDPSNCPNNTAIVSVTDDVGDPVSGLGASNFTLHEDGSQQSISVQCGGSATGDLAVALVLDSSGSLDSTDVQNIKDASTQFINMLGANDQIAVWDFDSSVTLLQDYTTNKQAAINAVNQIDSSGYTSLYDAIYDAADHSSVVSGRKALVVMTDGLNNDSSHTQQEAIDQANAMGVPVFTIGFGNANSNVLTNIANQTGGLFYQGASSSDLQTILNQIGQTLSSQCEISWTTPHADGGTHNVQIKVQVGSESDTKTKTYSQAGTPCAGGGGGINIVINQVDPSNCPQIAGVVSVTDGNGNPITGLGPGNFTVTEDGVTQTITSVSCGGSGTGDLAVALVLDSSGSLSSTDVQNIKDASTQFINMLGANDQIAVWDFDSSVTLLQDYTTNKQAAINAVNQIDSSGYTSLYDAIYDAADHSSVVSGRKALVVMTDGLNNDSSHTQQEAIDQANAMGVPVFTIGFGNANSNVLTNIANQTGGLFYQGATSSDLQTILGQIGQTLSNQCVITWTTSHPDGGSHTVKISVQVGSSSDWKTTTYTQAGTPCGGGGGGREVILVDSNGSPGGTVTVPIHLISLGDENALGFTVTFDTSKLSNPSVTLGSAASGATLNTNTNQASSGRVGIALSLSANQTFASGQREIARVTFNISSSVATGSTTNVLFGDTPIVREISDTSANALPAIWTPGTVTFGAPGYEADVAPRSSGGNGSVTTTDWVQVGRFVAALDTASAGSEFQKADCAPRSSLGNGSITTTDWVQAGRYAAALDPLTAAGGPTSKGKGAPAQSAAKAAGRMLRLSAATIDRGQSGNVFLDLVSAGDENAIGFSLDFNPGALTYQNVALGSGASGATLNVNDTQASSGHLGIVMALPAGETFAAGVQQLVVVAFQAAAGSSTVTTPIAFSDTPVIREVSDVVAEVLPTTYEGSRVMLAAGDIDDPFRVCRNPATARDQDAAVAYNPDRGEYLVVWSDERNAASRGADIWGQRVGADGSLVGSHIRLSGNAATGDEYHPYAVYDSEHTQYMVVWSDTRLAGSQGSDIWSQLVDADGTKLGINRRVTGAAAVGDDTHPSMAYNPGTDTYVVVWSDNRYPSSRGTDIWAQKLTPTNEKTGLNYRISGGRADGDDGAPAIVYNSAEDEFLIAFECYRNNRWTIFGRRLDGGGDRETLNFVVSGTAGTAHRSPSLAYNAVRNEYVLVWSDDRNAGPRGWDIFAQVLTATGDRDGQTYRVCNVRARGDDLAPSIAYSTASDRYAVVWQDGRNTQSRGEDVWGQLLASDGSLAGDELRISGGGATADELLFPGGGAVAASSSGYALVVCTDTRNAGSRGWDVWGRIVDM